MKSVSCIAVLLAVAATGCAGPQASVGSDRASTASRSAAYYCSKEKLVAEGGMLRCNWEPTIDEACRVGKTSTIDRASLASEPQPAGRCSTGEWLVKATPR